METIIRSIAEGKGHLHDSTLPSGLRVITIPDPNRTHIHLEFRLRAGSYHDGETRGGHHYFEHLFLPESKRAWEMALIKRSIRIHLWTSRFYSYYEMDIDTENLKEGLQILNDLLFKPNFSQKDLEAERSIILNEELREHREHVQRAQAMRRFYPSETGLYHPTVGFPEDIQKITLDDLVDLYQRHFHPRNLLCVAAGNITHEKLINLLERLGLADADRPMVKDSSLVVLKNTLRLQNGPPIKLKRKLTDIGSPYIMIRATMGDKQAEQTGFRMGLKALCMYPDGPLYKYWRLQEHKMYAVTASTCTTPERAGSLKTVLPETDHKAFREKFFNLTSCIEKSNSFREAYDTLRNEFEIQEKRKKSAPFDCFKAIENARELFHWNRVESPSEWRKVTFEQVCSTTKQLWNPERCSIMRGVRRGY